MNFLEQELEKRKLPKLMECLDGSWVKNAQDWEIRRGEIETILSRDFLGYAVRLGVKTTCETVRVEERSYGGKAVTEYQELHVRSDFSEGMFPFTLTLPKSKNKVPVFFFLSFTHEIAGGIGEEILDQGYGIANVCYQDIAADYYDGHQTGLGRFCTRNPYDSWGKLKIWSWAVSRMLDVLLEDERIDEKRIAVMGHSRLGKTALAAGAFDSRFSLTVSCQSGAGGAALFRGKSGEQIENLYGKGSRLWFDGNFFRYLGKIEELPFDQHFLLALVAPRHLYVCSATEDAWADPPSEYLGCAAADPAWKCLGYKGFVGKDGYPNAGEAFHEGEIGYHLRKGTHYLSREDWKLIIEYRKRHQV